MMAADGDKKKGRYLKKGSPTFNIVNVTEFSFVEICKKELIFKDNPTANIIHHRFHSEDEVKRLVERHPTFHEPLINAENRPPLLRPRDFTEEWLEQRKRAKKRAAHMDDEDEYEMALEEELRREEEEEEAVNNLKKKRERRRDKAAGATAEAKVEVPEEVQPEPEAKPQEMADAKLKELQSPQINFRNSIEIVDEAIKNFHEPQPGSAVAKPEEKVAPPVLAQPVAVPPAPLPPEAPSRNLEGSHVQEPAASSAGDRVPGLIEKLETAIRDLAQTKRSVLTSVQDNFYQIAKGICEALVEKEIKANPQVLGNIIQQAIDASIKDDKFTIKVHPETLKQLREVSDLPFLKQLSQDSNLPEGAFRVESDLSVVDSSVKDVIAKLLASADLRLFDDSQTVVPEVTSKPEV